MAELIYPNIVGSFQQGQSVGRQFQAEDEARQNQSRLSQLAAQAYGASGQDRQSAIQQAIGVDPQAGLALGGALGQQEDRQTQELVRAARFLKAVPAEQKQAAWSQVRGSLAQRFPQMQLPEQYDATVDETVNALDAAYGGGGKPSFDRYRNVGGALIDLGGDPTKPIYQAPGAPIMTSEGLVRPTATGVELLELGGGQPPGLQPEQDFAALGQQFGLTPTSVKRSAQRNEEVGGVPNSFHLTGQAADWVVPPDQKVAFMQAAKQRGYQAIDEGDHVHIEPPGSPRAQGGRRLLPPNYAAEQERLQIARDANARSAEASRLAAESADQRRRFGTIPAGFRVNAAGTALEAVPGGPKPAGSAATEGERKAATLLKRMEFSENQLRQAVRESPSAASPEVTAEVARSLPFIGDAAANTINSSERQRVEAAQLDLLDAALTLGTGAAYTKEQLRGYARSYFPQIGDTDDTIRDKAARLKNLIDAAKIAAGRASPAASAPDTQGRPALPPGFSWED